MLPPFLKEQDEVRIVSPSGVIDPQYVDGAKRVLSEWNLKVTEGQFVRSAYGRFAGTKEQRISDLQNAFDDPAVKAVLCSRGGYGLAQIIDKIDFSSFVKQPKWLIGFSDVTVLHNAISKLDTGSLHAFMAKHLTELPETSVQVEAFKEILFGQLPKYSFSGHVMNRQGVAQGKLIGGNLSVLYGLRGTGFDLSFEGNILFIEDIAEKAYHIDRMIQNLRLGGVFDQISGLIVGQFSDCDEDPQMNQTIKELIAEAAAGHDYPVCFDFPAGHVDNHFPLIMGTSVELIVEERIMLHFKY